MKEYLNSANKCLRSCIANANITIQNVNPPKPENIFTVFTVYGYLMHNLYKAKTSLNSKPLKFL